MRIPTIGIGPADVANHRRYAPATEVLDYLERYGWDTADEIASYLELSTRDVVATLNVLAAHRSVYVFGDDGPDREMIRDAYLGVLRRPDGTGQVMKDRGGVPRVVSTAEMAVLEAHRPVLRRVTDGADDRPLPAVWGLA